MTIREAVERRLAIAAEIDRLTKLSWRRYRRGRDTQDVSTQIRALENERLTVLLEAE